MTFWKIYAAEEKLLVVGDLLSDNGGKGLKYMVARG